MANMRLPEATRNSQLDSLRALIDAGSGPGTIKIYTGTQPATGGGSLSGNTLLGTLTLSDPAAGAASGGDLTLSPITEDSSADATGTATWARVADSDGNTVFDCDVSATGGGGTIQLNTTNIVSGGPIRITASQITQPGG
jgi:hypothetical protein